MTQDELRQLWLEIINPDIYSFWKGKILSDGRLLARVDDDIIESWPKHRRPRQYYLLDV